MSRTTPFLVTAAISMGLASLLAARAAERGDLIFTTNFEQADALVGWARSDAATLVSDTGRSTSLKIELPSSAKPTSVTTRFPLPVETMRGCAIFCEAMVKAESVIEPPNVWNGVKFMLHSIAPDRQNHAQRNRLQGTFDWKPVRFVARIAEDATEAWLHLGLEATTGRAWFDDLRITIGHPPTQHPTTPAAGPVYKGHELPRLRGAMVPQRIDEEGLRVFGRDWNANLIRWQLTRYFVPNVSPVPSDLASYDTWLLAALEQMDAMLPACEKFGLMVVIDLHFAPGGSRDGQSLLFREQKYQDHFVRTWQTIARHSRDQQAVWGYDLVNEPMEGVVADGLLDWHDLAERAAEAIRDLDPNTAIVVEPGEGGNPYGFTYFEPIDVPNVVYSFHMYLPHQFTHQGVHGAPSGFIYPGRIGNADWDKNRLRTAVQPALDFQRACGVHLYVGEFSAARWAPDNSAYRYLRDCIELFEEHGWDWSYHAFRESHIWSVELGPDPDVRDPPPPPTDREKLLRTWFRKNRKP